MTSPPPASADVEMIPVSEIELAAYNPRVPAGEGSRLRADLEKSFDTFGLVLPLVWNRRTGRLVAGHQRFAVLTERGANEIPCAVVDLDDRAEKALNVALNFIDGEWQPEQLNAVLADIGQEPALAAAAGFTETEIESLRQLASLDAQLSAHKTTARADRVGERTEPLTEKDAPSALAYPPKADGLPDISELPERVRKVGVAIAMWQRAVRLTPNEFLAALDIAAMTGGKENFDAHDDPLAAACQVQLMLETLPT